MAAAAKASCGIAIWPQARARRGASTASWLRPDAASWGERQRLQPRFRSLRYGDQDYGKLAPECAWEVACGADDGAEMGAYHDLHRSSLMLARVVPVRRQGRGLAPMVMRESDRRECVA
ncbi:hypothetical protein LP420_07785 [Massilia sp. B-10]|nr:hypothetical protein LP420_07785 [Massilia sp. B-10]